jgi:hypothetical protein
MSIEIQLKSQLGKARSMMKSAVPKGKARKVDRISIEHTKGGGRVLTHEYKRPMGGDYESRPEPEKHSFSSHKEMLTHMQTCPDCSATGI